MTGVAITLTPEECRLAIVVGTERNLGNVLQGRQHRHGYAGGGWSIHIEGAAAELAYSKFRDRYWTGALADSPVHTGDVGLVEIRSTARPDGALIIHRTDHDERPYVLVTGRMPTVRLVGWLYGAEAKRDEFWRTDTGRPAFFAPQSELHHFKAASPAAVAA